MANGGQQRSPLLWLGFLVEGCLAALAVLLGWLFEQPVWENIRWHWQDALWGIVATLPMLAGFLICLRWPVGPLARIKQFSDEVIRPLFAPCTILELGAISLLAGFGEEALFRGVIQELLSRWLGVVAGLFLASFLFGLLHMITPTYALLAMLTGIYLGCWWLARDDLIVVIVAHAAYDWIALIILVRRPP